MNIAILAIGRMKAGPESELLVRYLERARAAGRQQGVASISVREFVESPAASPQLRQAAESSALRAALSPKSFCVALDERGVDKSSAGFAAMLRERLESGERELAFVIGGADGHDAALRSDCALSLRFGKSTWPHQLVRVLLAEQIYRAITILSGHPYHRQ